MIKCKNTVTLPLKASEIQPAKFEGYFIHQMLKFQLKPAVFLMHLVKMKTITKPCL